MQFNIKACKYYKTVHSVRSVSLLEMSLTELDNTTMMLFVIFYSSYCNMNMHNVVLLNRMKHIHKLSVFIYYHCK